VSEIIDFLLEIVRSAVQTDLGAGALVASGAGTAFLILRTLPGRLLRLAERQCLVSVDILGSDHLFEWVKEWLNAQPYSRRARRLTASAMYRSGPTTSSSEPRILFTPAPGNHVLWYNGRPVWLQRERKEMPGRDGMSGGYQETLTLRVLGRSADSMRGLLEEAQSLALMEEQRVGVHVLRWGDWTRISQIRARPLDSVILPPGQMEAIVADAERFLASRTRYEEVGVPWRRGYLFEGLPGSGKSSTIGALAGHLKLDLYICNVSDKTMTDEKLIASLVAVPERSAVLLEDVDGVVAGRDVQGESGVTFAGLLNAIDGVASKPGIITFLTTNYVERLDAALIRNGRVDHRVRFEAATADQAHRLFARFYDLSADCEAARAFGEAMAGKPMADAQAVLLANWDEPEAAVRAVASAPVPVLQLARS
jgi:chaperone BCS1